MTEIERVARELCAAAGENPDRRMQEYGQTSHHYPAWELFREKAIERINREFHAAQTPIPITRQESEMAPKVSGCPHETKDCPLYWAMHDGLGGSCWPDDGELQTGCAVDKGASYARLFGAMSTERYEALRGIACRPLQPAK